MTILVVDDDFDLRDTLRDVLQDEGFDVATAEDGLAALDYLRTNPAPDVIVLDWMMPRCDAAQFREQQMADAQLAAIPVVLLTANQDHDEKRRQLGLSYSLAKPVSRATLLSVLRQVAPPR